MTTETETTPENKVKTTLYDLIRKEYSSLWGERDRKYLIRLTEIYSNIDNDLTGNISRISSKIGDLRNKKILDFGCGWGNFLIYCLKSGYDIVGVDISKSRCEFFKLMIEELRLPKTWKSRYIIYEGYELPFKTERLDIVIANQVLEHVRDLRKTLDEIRRVLKSGGIFYIRSPDYSRSFFEPHYRVFWFPLLRYRFAELYLKLIGKPTEGLNHINYIGKKTLLKLLRQTGFSLIYDMEKEIVIEDRKSKIRKMMGFLPNRFIDIINSMYEVFRNIKMIGREENKIDIIVLRH